MKTCEKNGLAHGEFGNWLKNVNLDRTQAHRLIKVSEEIKDVGTHQHLGLRALLEIASLPVPERTKEHTTSNGETKTPDEMTVQELRELKKQLKQRDEENAQLQSQMKQAQRSEEIARKQYKYGLNNYIFTIKF
ncbi:TPA: pathogenicity island protein [Staphylococcus aureus]|nr:pathogenicity island protein [Staphylococcus aureus]